MPLYSTTEWEVKDRIIPKPTVEERLREMWQEIDSAVELGNCPESRKRAKLAMFKIRALLKRLQQKIAEYEAELDAYEQGLRYMEANF